MTQIALLAVLLPAAAQDLAEYKIYTEPPRLLLNERRLKLLQRETTRNSLRWEQFQALMAGGATMSEPGFAGALYGAVAKNPEACRKASTWAATSDDLRQVALACDWCKPSNRTSLVNRLKPLLSKPPANVTEARNITFAAVALADDEPDASARALRGVIEGWWRGKMVPVLESGRNPFRDRAEVYALMELLHAIRDNLRIEMRDDARRFFDDLPALEMLTYYPASWPTPENQYRVPVYDAPGEPDLREATLGRAADLALVASDTNSQPNQFLQGWLMLDRFLMRSALGIPYEFLWANPYQPGLSYYYMPELYHAHGKLILRSSWDEDATWFSYENGQAQMFREGQRIGLRLGANPAPIELGDIRLVFPPSGLRFEVGLKPPTEDEPKNKEELVFVLNLKPKQKYDVEVDNEEMFEASADEAGILELRFPKNRKAGVRLKEVRAL